MRSQNSSSQPSLLLGLRATHCKGQFWQRQCEEINGLHRTRLLFRVAVGRHQLLVAAVEGMCQSLVVTDAKWGSRAGCGMVQRYFSRIALTTGLSVELLIVASWTPWEICEHPNILSQSWFSYLKPQSPTKNADLGTWLPYESEWDRLKKVARVSS